MPATDAATDGRSAHRAITIDLGDIILGCRDEDLAIDYAVFL